MWVLIAAVVTASLMGSMHCVGMCGPLAIWASGGGERFGRRQMLAATTLYHFGRLLTYALAGLTAGGMGQLVDIGGQALGVQLVAARIVGTLMVAFGSYRLWQLLRISTWWNKRGVAVPAANPNGDSRLARVLTPGSAVPTPSWITAQLMRLRPYVFRLPLPARGLVTGLLTAFLPCGWLYLFALAAAGTGSIVMGPVVMVSFWIGTVPALVALVAGSQMLATRFRRVIPAAVAATLIVAGGYTASGRGFASLHSLSDVHTGFANVKLDDTAASSQNASCQCSAGGECCGNCNLDPSASLASNPDLERLADGIEGLTKTPLPCCTQGEGGAAKP